MAIVGQEGLLAFHDSLQVDRPAPYELYVSQRVVGMVQLQIDAIMFVFQQQFSAIAVIPIHDVYPRLAEVGQPEEQPLLDLLKLP